MPTVAASVPAPCVFIGVASTEPLRFASGRCDTARSGGQASPFVARLAPTRTLQLRRVGGTQETPKVVPLDSARMVVVPSLSFVCYVQSVHKSGAVAQRFPFFTAARLFISSPRYGLNRKKREGAECAKAEALAECYKFTHWLHEENGSRFGTKAAQELKALGVPSGAIFSLDSSSCNSCDSGPIPSR